MTAIDQDADRELKAKHRGMWALGDYGAVAREVIPELGSRLVTACGIGSADRVLDVAAGTGNAAIPAALAGARVTATDLTPELLDAGRRDAAARGAMLRWQVGDAEELPVPDGEFDVVLSCVGLMFAPHHDRAAAEVLRTCRPGGRIGLINWTPEGFVGQLFATMKPYLPSPPPGSQPPPLWGREQHVQELLGDRVSSLGLTRHVLRVDRFGSPAEFRDFFKSQYGPTVAAYRGIADQPDRVAALDDDLVALASRFDLGGGAMEWEYLMVLATV